MRWNETCTLFGKTYQVDSEGVPQPTPTEKQVFCNPRTIGANTWSSMYEIGISPQAEIQLRSCDYSGERDVFYSDEYMSVEKVTEQGDLTVLTLRYQKSDSDDTPSEEVPND